MKIEKFKLEDSLGDYDKLNNPRKLSIAELFPIAVSWNYNGQNYKIKNNNKLSALLLNNKNQIALIESPFENNDNEASIINGNNEKIWDVSSIFRSLYKDFIVNKNIVFNDIYYIDGELNFIVIVNNIDYRFSFNTDNGNVGELIESR